jgi:lycopene cyclase CruA
MTLSADRALGLIRERGGDELTERLTHLDRCQATRTRAKDTWLGSPADDDAVDADVVFMGGGLSLLIAAALQRLGLRVTVLERKRAGCTHREWNASGPELEPLVRAGLVTAEELRSLVVARYDHGICSFGGGPPYRVTGVLDHAVDAAALLAKVRDVAERRGVRFIDRASVCGLGLGPSKVRVGFQLASGAQPQELTARLAVDARGASSPYATADLVCPTVGGVMRGLRHDDRVGDILVTTEGADQGRQHVWEGFPGKRRTLTTYLFYYAASRPKRGVPPHSLVSLYARFFDRLATYKTGHADLERPTFGFIPGWSRLTPAPAGPSDRVVLVGDAAARHSPLTFCGFGSMLRSFQSVARTIADRVEGGNSDGAAREFDEAIHGWTGLLARMMASEALTGDRLNTLLNHAFYTLYEQGNDVYASLLRDEMSARAFVHFLRQTAKKHPAVYTQVLGALGPMPAARWAMNLVKGTLA